MNTALLFLVVCLAAFYCWYVVGAADLPLVAGPRERLVRWIENNHDDRWASGIECPFCAGFWVSAAVVATLWNLRGLPLPGLWFVAVPGVVGLLGSRLDG